jgi:hypothetical protein
MQRQDNIYIYMDVLLNPGRWITLSVTLSKKDSQNKLISNAKRWICRIDRNSRNWRRKKNIYVISIYSKLVENIGLFMHCNAILTKLGRRTTRPLMHVVPIGCVHIIYYLLLYFLCFSQIGKQYKTI